MALIMSTGDSMLLICGTTVSWGIVRVLRPGTKEQHLLLVSQVVILVAGACSALRRFLCWPDLNRSGGKTLRQNLIRKKTGIDTGCCTTMATSKYSECISSRKTLWLNNV